MDLLIQVGLIELAVAALLGWAVVIKTQKPDRGFTAQNPTNFISLA